MEKKKYISYNQRIIDRLADFGFKRKNKNLFVRKLSEGVSQELSFGHSTQGRAHVKYYDIRAVIVLPEVLKIAQELNIYMPSTAFYNCNIGELMPKSNYLEWLIGEDTSEKYDNKVIDSMLYHVEKYAIPFLNKYSTSAAIVEGIRNCAYSCRYGENLHACIALFLYGKREDFLWFVEQRSYEIQFDDYEHEGHWDYRHPKVPLSRACKEFLECAGKLEPLYLQG
jgi:hypothetical protein